MRIIFFSHYYTPEVNAPASRTSEHCRAWAAGGHDVTVVTCAPNHPNGVIYPGFRNLLYQQEMIDGVRVIRLWTWLAANKGFARRTLNYLSFLAASILALPWLPRADVMISTSPQFFCGLTGLFLRPFKRAPWVLEIRDLWPESIVAVGAMKKGRAIRFVEWLEKLAYRQADAIVSVTKSFVPHIAERGGDGKICVIRNGADLGTFVRSDQGGAVKKSLGLEGKFIATYVGTHGMARGLVIILDAAEMLRDDPRIAFLTVGDGAELARLQAEKAARGLDNLTMLGQRPKSEMPGFWGATDASLVVLKQSDTFKKVLPSKMMEAMAMRCPIILGVEGEARDVLMEAQAGIPIAPESARELADAILSIAGDPAGAAVFGHNGRDFACAQFDRSALAARYIELLEGVVARHRGVKPKTQDAKLGSGAE